MNHLELLRKVRDSPTLRRGELKEPMGSTSRLQAVDEDPVTPAFRRQELWGLYKDCGDVVKKAGMKTDRGNFVALGTLPRGRQKAVLPGGGCNQCGSAGGDACVGSTMIISSSSQNEAKFESGSVTGTGTGSACLGAVAVRHVARMDAGKREGR
ncbi:hypothetical protein T265_08331 [Opisthorchis viverrini]|uniref:Uncharacterized protein n=1 Tax=Opisthorchis viverrini TaxID=6198 RepID=A0A074ZE34_OPIVI|nr:hypothetical protein T265_08331 [Opisthorchis viverrini]KER23912.1 hypothetical protein T265_08331 [Opisthorchis viverrini]